VTIVDFREKTEALETVRTPPFSKNYDDKWALFCCCWGRRTDVAGSTVVSPASRTSLCSRRSAPRRPTAPRWRTQHWGGAPAVQASSRSDWRDSHLVGFVLFYEAPGGRATVPCLYSKFRTECSRHQHQQNCFSRYCTYCIYWDRLQREAIRRRI